MGQDENSQYTQLTLHIASEFFLDHNSKDVRLLIACCIADIFRIFAPDAPYKDGRQLKVGGGGGAGWVCCVTSSDVKFLNCQIQMHFFPLAKHKYDNFQIVKCSLTNTNLKAFIYFAMFVL